MTRKEVGVGEKEVCVGQEIVFQGEWAKNDNICCRSGT
jgi:hypothetical protein